MHFLTADLLTEHISREGAKDMLVAVGIIEHEIYVPEFSVSRHDRERYTMGVLHTLGYALACQAGGHAQHRRAIGEWAKRSAAELEGLLGGSSGAHR